MSQILCWDIDYKPASKPWSTVKCQDKKKVLDYLQPDSIILVSSEIWASDEFKQFLTLSKVHYPNVQLGIVTTGKKKGNSIVTYLKSSEIELFIQGCMRRQFKLVDHKKMIEDSEKLITKN
jgi:hypothetical protein